MKFFGSVQRSAGQFLISSAASFLLSLLLADCSAALYIAQQTNPASITQDDQGRSPRPTQRAQVPEDLHNDLKLLAARQNSYSTCAFVSGISASSLTCSPGYECAVNSFGAAGCCPANDFQNCALPTACVPYTELGSCGNACLSDPFIRRCNDLLYSECFTVDVGYNNGDTYSVFMCNTAPGWITAYQSYTDGLSTFILPEPTTVTKTAISAGGDTYVINMPSTSNDTTTKESKKGLTTEAKIGIGVGVPSAVFALIGLFIMCYKR